MRRLIMAAALAALLPVAAFAQSDADLIKGDKDTHNIFYGGGYSQDRYSPLKKINAGNVAELRPVWALQLPGDKAQEAQPILWNGVLYYDTYDTTLAVDVVTGHQLWKTTIQYPADFGKVVCCAMANRGVAVYEGKVFRTTLDANVLAYDAKTGKELWKTTMIDYKLGYSSTAAPLVADGVLITGMSGGEYGVRGFLDGWDPATGKHLWRRYTVACPGEPGGDTWPAGDACQHGGASTWITGSYDPKLHLVYWGTSNAASWYVKSRPGDNLYTASVVAITPKTGEIKWHYQFSPHEGLDFDGVNEMVLTTVRVGGKSTDVILHADRNGFLYVIDRANGKLLAAHPFTKVNWAKEIDLKTGRPVLTDAAIGYYERDEAPALWPALWGGKNWNPMSYNPNTGLLYINAMVLGFKLKQKEATYHAGVPYFGVQFLGDTVPADVENGRLEAIDPLTGKVKWYIPSVVQRFSGTLSTGGGLVFTGALTGEFEAFDASTGKKLWSFNCGAGVESQPITFEKDGEQYIVTTSGMGNEDIYIRNDARVANVPRTGTLWAFALHNKKPVGKPDAMKGDAKMMEIKM